MKSIVLYTLIASLSFAAMPVVGQGTCPNGGGQQPGVGPTSPFPTAADVVGALMPNGGPTWSLPSRKAVPAAFGQRRAFPPLA
jgi:hypothetical protein